MANIKYKGRPSIPSMVKALQKPVKIPGAKRAPKIKEATPMKSYRVRSPKIY